jgi:hypothetical protein
MEIPTKRKFSQEELATMYEAQHNETDKHQDAVDAAVERSLRQWCVDQAVKVCPISQPVTRVTHPFSIDDEGLRDVVTVQLIASAIFDFITDRKNK